MVSVPVRTPSSATVRVLVIGSEHAAHALRGALNEVSFVSVPSPIRALAARLREPFDAIVVSTALGARTPQVVAAARRIRSNARILVLADAVEEPLARQAALSGADQYLIAPVQEADLRSALVPRPSAPTPPEAERVALPETPAPRSAPAPSPGEVARLGEILRQIDDGPAATIERFAELLRSAFDAVGAEVRVEDSLARSGDCERLVLEETLAGRTGLNGRVALGRRRTGAYSSSAGARLAEYAALVEIAVSQARERAQLKSLASTDELSALHNRRHLDQRLDELLAHAARQRGRVTVFLFDIDDFKTYNDQRGHAAGDALIRELSQVLAECTRRDDVVARYGGDEFAVVLWDAEEPRVPGSRHPTEAVALCERIRDAIAAHAFRFLGSERPGPVTISGGLATYPWNGATREELLASADQALRDAKRVGKNRILLAGSSAAETPSS